MFSFLFGRRSDKDKTQQIAGAVAIPTSSLQQRENELEKKIRQLEKIKESHHNNAIEQKAKGNTNSALHFLKKEKLIDDELASANGMLLTIIQQRSALEQALLNRESLQVLDQANKSIKESQTIWTTDRVSDLVDQMEDARSVAREINDLIASSNRFDIPDDELLASLELQTKENNLVSQVNKDTHIPEIPNSLSSGFAINLPVSPTTEIKNTQTQTQTQTMLQRLEAI